jgi:hypothetical protein
MAPLASVFVAVRPNMITFAGEAAAGISAARLGAAGVSQGAAFGKSFGASASKLMVAGFAVGLGALLKASVEAAGDFQSAMVRLTTSAGETGTRVSGNLKIVADGILAMAGPVGTTVEALGKAMYTVESGSFHGADALKVLRAAAEGAKAENADLTKVTNATTTALVDYHLSADHSAEIVSKLVAATAAGKTTFEGLTGALHSVLPVASAAGISIDDILGSLASMTLHGISAEQATQNLADAIRHMQNPTAVQAKELALLGLTTNQLTTDLKTKGLSGTLKEIADRIKNLMPPGSDQVILELQTALSTLSPKVRELGMRLIDGSISYIQYRKAARDLTPIQASQAMAFATLAGSTHRLGDQQVSGAQVMQSYSGALARATGDATGMNVALQLTGENAENTARSIGMVAGATTEAGDHVAGWAAIQETFNFKMQSFHATLGAVQISLGQALLPVLTNLVGKITEILPPIATWITGHERLTAQIAGTAGALVALSGSVIVVTKLAAAFAGMMNVLRITAAAQWLLNAAVGTNVVITSAAELQIAAYLVWSRLAAVSTKVWAAVQWALNAAFLASPWGLIVVAIAAVVGGIVWAFFHFKGFHNFIIGAWDWIKTAGIAVWHALIIAFHAVADAGIWLWQHALKPAWEGIVVGAKFVWQGIQLYFAAIKWWFGVLADVAVWLWQHALKPMWEGIVVGAKFVWEGIQLYFAAIKWWFGILADVAMWLYKNIFHPVFTGIEFLVHAFWVVIQIYFALVKIYFENVVWPVIKFLWTGVFKPVLEAIGAAAMWLWNSVIHPVFSAIGTAAMWLWDNALKPAWHGIVNFITDVLAPAFVWLWHNVIEPVWNGIKTVISVAWNDVIKPVFHFLADFVTKDIPNAFGKSVDFIGAAWNRIKAVVTAPISWVIDTVINRGLIDTINKVADAVGVKDRIPHVGNPFADNGGGGGGGGKAPSFMASGGLLSGPGGPRDDLIPIMASNGEYIIPAHVVRDLGVNYFDSLIGRRKPQHPGDGSSGIAIGRYADGGLVEAFTDPAKWLGNKANSLIDQIPGGGAIRGLAIGASRKLVGTLVTWVKNKLGFGDAGGNVGAAQAFIRSQAGKPYVWASAGPDGYDCSGIVSAVWNMLHGRSPYSHTFSTGDEAPYFPKPGMGVFTAGWANPGEQGGGRVGHTAGWLAGLPFESTGSQGVHIGSGVTPVDSFAHMGHMWRGGLVRRYDGGGPWPSGTLGINTSGRTEHVTTGDGMDQVIQELRMLREAVEHVAPGVGKELRGSGRSLLTAARAR